MDNPTSDDIHALLNRARAGEPAAAQVLFGQVYQQLRRLAGSYLQGRPGGGTLQPTALVHEAFLRLARPSISFRDRGHFLAVAALAMRQIITDYARRRHADKRGGRQAKITLDEAALGHPPGGARPASEGVLVDVLALDGALRRLAESSPQQARIIELRYFGGLTVEEVAEALEVSVGLVEKEWRRARAWLSLALELGAKPAGSQGPA